MEDQVELNRLIGLLYDAVLNEAQWDCALQALSRFTGGTAVGQVIADPIKGIITQCATLNIDPDFKDAYVGYYAAKEVRLGPAVEFGIGQVLTESMLIEQSELRKSEIYNEMLRPFDVPHFMFAWLQKSETKVQTIALEGSHSHGAFDARAVARFNRVMPHLVRAARMRDQFITIRESQKAYREALETLPFGIIFLDGHGQVIESTRLAESIMTMNSGLHRVRGRLHAMCSEDDDQLQLAIRDAVYSPFKKSATARSVSVRRLRCTSRLKITLLPIVSIERFSMAAKPSILVALVDPDLAPSPWEGLLESTLRLTKAEAALARSLFSGLTLRQSALDLGRSINTCKTQLKVIYSKTGCRNHADLAKTLVMTALGERHAASM
jgi:DNA-binding CsgD family transcriptional regulator